MPTSSILNVDQANQTRAAAGIFPVSTAGVALYLSGGGHIVVDLLGYFTGPSAGAGTEGLFTAYDPTRLLDTRDASPLGSGVPLYPGGGLELPTSQGGTMAYNVTSVDGAAGFVTAFPAGTARPSTSTVNSVGGGDVVANFAITQVSSRGLGFFSQSQTHLVADLQGWFSGPVGHGDPAAPCQHSPSRRRNGFSACSDGRAVGAELHPCVGRRRRRSHSNAAAQDFACSYALQLASAPGTFAHSNSAARDAAVGCPTGENIAYASGTAPSTLISMWYASAPHMANIKNSSYGSAAPRVRRTHRPLRRQTIYGVTVFALC